MESVTIAGQRCLLSTWLVTVSANLDLLANCSKLPELEHLLVSHCLVPSLTQAYRSVTCYSFFFGPISLPKTSSNSQRLLPAARTSSRLLQSHRLAVQKCHMLDWMWYYHCLEIHSDFWIGHPVDFTASPNYYCLAKSLFHMLPYVF